ncbi:2-keto-4-pentenoate hydratase [Nonomuraea gerenzanensis]|uniref:2-keto-4-pentenoate hydratase n=1 Tax=Nonomuraea gerenzanensis TaxID=93944 RepID=UPI001CD98920|nr:fumarylacetoacetate hydrolase family protein [Nonomuraea gerenzanensis]UBU12583.1 fumarylacetoacetate hydrolase family protein [Nonomuraea gerenzanensis]
MRETTGPHGRAEIAAAAERPTRAAASGVPCAPVRDLIGRDDLAAAYAVQAALTESRLAAGARIVGRKIGLTSEAVQRRLGVDQPDRGVLFEDMAHADGEAIPAGRVLQPRAEAEIAFVLRSDLAAGPLDGPQVRDSTARRSGTRSATASPRWRSAAARIAGWDISFGDTVADNASAGAYVLGTERRALDAFEPRDVAMPMSVNGEEVSTGTGAACLGDPVEALAWLARMARDLGEPLRAGQVVLPGALGPMRPVAAGDTVTATLSGLGTVTARCTEGATV